MNYKKVYDNLIQKYQLINLPKLKLWDPDSVSIETHHIIPVCLGGKNNKENLVNLTSKAHYVAHHLLYKANIGTRNEHKLLKAFTMMLYIEDHRCQRRSVRITSKVFQNIKNQLSIYNSIKNKERWNNLTSEQKRIHIERSHTKQANEKRKLSCSKVKRTEEWNKKNSIAHIGKKYSKERIDNVKLGLKRFWESEQGKKKKLELSNKRKGRKVWNKGIKRTAEERMKMSNGRRRNYQIRKLCSILRSYIDF